MARRAAVARGMPRPGQSGDILRRASAISEQAVGTGWRIGRGLGHQAAPRLNVPCTAYHALFGRGAEGPHIDEFERRMAPAQLSGARDLQSFGRRATPAASTPTPRVRWPGCVSRFMVGLPARPRVPIPSAAWRTRPRSAGCSDGRSTWRGPRRLRLRPCRRHQERLPRRSEASTIAARCCRGRWAVGACCRS